MYVYYKFDDDFNDATENAIHGFGSNSPTFVEGVAAGSKAVKFNRTNNSSFVVAKPIIDSRDMTISFGVKISAMATSSIWCLLIKTDRCLHLV